jgi:sodium transport system permease protein
MQIMRLAAHTIVLDVPWGNAVAASLVIVPAALLFASAFVALGALARTFKEAQTLLLPVYFLTLTPALAGAVGDYRLAGIVAWVPGMNMTLLARDLLVGRATWSGGLATTASTLLLSLAALYAAAHIYDSERLVVPPPRRAARPRGPAPVTTAGDALVLFALAFLLLYFVFLPIEQQHLALGLVVAEWLGMFGLVMLYARISGQRFATAIGLGRPAPLAVLGGLLVGCSAWAAVSLVSEWLLPVPKHLVEELRKTIVPSDGSRGFWSTVLLMALTPAVCEETLFRGPILRGLRTRASPIAAAAITGVLFGLIHLDLYRLLPAMILGTLLGLIVLECGSILPAMLAHLCNNAILIALAQRRLDERMESLGHRALSLIFIASVVLTAAGFLLLRRARRGAEL